MAKSLNLQAYREHSKNYSWRFFYISPTSNLTRDGGLYLSLKKRSEDVEVESSESLLHSNKPAKWWCASTTISPLFRDAVWASYYYYGPSITLLSSLVVRHLPRQLYNHSWTIQLFFTMLTWLCDTIDRLTRGNSQLSEFLRSAELHGHALHIKEVFKLVSGSQPR